MATNANDNHFTYTPVRITNPEDLPGGSGSSNSSVGTNGSAIPTSSTAVGVSDGTNLQAPRAFDADSGAGTQYVLGAILRKSASGGSVEAGTSSDPMRTDPTGTTTQPVSLVAGTNAFGKLSANTAATYIGDVVVPLATSAFQDTDTNVTAGTRRTLASHASLVFGFYVTNTHATATIYIGTAAGVSSTAFIFRLAPGQSTPLIPLTNSNVLGFDSSASGGTIAFGGF